MITEISFKYITSLLFLCGMLFCSTSFAQDPIFTHLYGGESVFNPALVGYRGSTVFTAKYKSEWAIREGEIPAYKSVVLTYEESMPCSILDYGLSIVADEEGEGLLQTLQVGGQFAGAIPFPLGRHPANIRIGGGIQFGQKRIDFSRLIFSDQLDPKFGPIFSTDFVPPGNNQSLWYMTPSLGASFRMILNNKGASLRSPSIHAGIATHNFFSLGKGDLWGDEESLLQAGTVLPSRITAFANFEIVPYLQNNQYVTVKFMGFYQAQQNIDAITAGVRLGLSRNFGVSTLIHFNETQQDGTNSNWLTYQVELNQIFNNNRVDLGFAYSRNYSGLRNQVGGIMEFTMSWHFDRSPLCGDNGYYSRDRGPVPCLTSKLTSAKRKLYEHIWYE